MKVTSTRGTAVFELPQRAHIVQVRTKEDKRCLFVTVDRTSNAYEELHRQLIAGWLQISSMLSSKTGPYSINTVVSQTTVCGSWACVGPSAIGQSHMFGILYGKKNIEQPLGRTVSSHE